MDKIRIGKDFDVRWSILTNGEVVDLAGRDLLLEVYPPFHEKIVLPFNIEGNTIIANISPDIQTSVGVYSLTLWENYGKDGQTAVDSCQAFALVSSSCAESDDSNTDVELKEVIELQTANMTFTPVVINGGGNVTVDTELSDTSSNPVQNKVVTKAVKDAHNAADSAMEVAINAQVAAEDAQESADGKQDKISDLDTIRSGAAKGATALQEHQDISGKLDKTEAATLYQPKGDYQPAGNYQPAGDYATSEALQNEITRATNEEKNIRALVEANKLAIDILAGSGGGSGGGSVVIVVDPALSETSENPVQNKAVTAGINEAKAAAQTAQATANEAKTAAGTAEQNAKDYANNQLKNYAKTEDLPTVPTKVSELENDADYITSADIPSIPDVSGLATKEEVSAVEKKIPTIPTDVSAFNNDAGYQTSNDVQEAIKGKANTSDVPTKTSELTNDSGFITAAQVPDVDTSNLATKTELAAKQDTIADLATIREDAAKGATAVQPSSLAKVATSGSYNDLRDKPTIPTVPTTDNVAYPMENHTEATLEIAPNVMHVWGEMAALTITLGAEVEDRANEYLFQFTSGATATTLTLPSTLTWANGEALAPEANKTYQASIVNGYAVYLVF